MLLAAKTHVFQWNNVPFQFIQAEYGAWRMWRKAWTTIRAKNVRLANQLFAFRKTTARAIVENSKTTERTKRIALWRWIKYFETWDIRKHVITKQCRTYWYILIRLEDNFPRMKNIFRSEKSPLSILFPSAMYTSTMLSQETKIKKRSGYKIPAGLADEWALWHGSRQTNYSPTNFTSALFSHENIHCKAIRRIESSPPETATMGASKYLFVGTHAAPWRVTMRGWDEMKCTDKQPLFQAGLLVERLDWRWTRKKHSSKTEIRSSGKQERQNNAFERHSDSADETCTRTESEA